MNTTQLQVFGEVLFDHFPDGSRVLGGAPFNVAWHLQAFGEAPRFISRVGDDAPGREIAALMDGWGMRRDALQVDPEHATGSVKVLIQDGEPHYEIVNPCAYDFIAGDLLESRYSHGILYHGSLAIRNPVSHSALQTVKSRHQGKIFIDVNLRPPWWEQETLLPLLHDAHWVKLNADELFTLSAENAALETVMQAFCARFDLETLIVTRGAQGAIAYDSRQGFIKAKPPASVAVVDTVGAGDAFAAVLLLGLHRQWTLEQTLERAQTFAAAVVGQRGATCADHAFYRAMTDAWK